MIHGCFLIDFTALFGFEIDRQVAVDNKRVSADVADIPAGYRVYAVDQMIRFVQPMALLLVAGQWVSAFPVERVEIDRWCVLRVSRNTHHNLLGHAGRRWSGASGFKAAGLQRSSPRRL